MKEKIEIKPAVRLPMNEVIYFQSADEMLSFYKWVSESEAKELLEMGVKS